MSNDKPLLPAGRSFLILLAFALSLLLQGGCRPGSPLDASAPQRSLLTAIRGDIVGTRGARPGWVVIHRGVIVAIHDERPDLPPGAVFIDHDGYIFPGLIDTHNHPHWNALPLWRSSKGEGTYANRYEWQEDSEYLRQVDVAYKALREGNAVNDALKYGEVRALVGGATAVQGSHAPPESRVLIRNLHTDYGADAFTGDIRSLTDEQLAKHRQGLDSGSLCRLYLHVAEGRRDDPVTREEFGILERQGLVRPGVVVIHGIGLDERDFRSMAEHGMYLAWSPRTNMVLYGETADVLAARAQGVVVALAPDWTITGSNNMLDELRYAHAYSEEHLQGALTPADLFRMTTVDAAAVAGLRGFAGEIRPGFAADLLLTPRLSADPYESLLRTEPSDIRLVMVDGVAAYGDPDLLGSLVDPSAVDDLEVQGTRKGVVVVGDLRCAPRADQRYGDVVRTLQNVLGDALAPLIEPDVPAPPAR